MSTYKWKRNTNFAYEKAKKPKGTKLATVNTVKRIVGNNADVVQVPTHPASASAVINAVANAGRVISLFNAYPTNDTAYIKDMHIKFRIDLPYIAGQTRCTSRVIIFQWREQTAPTVADVLLDTNVLSAYLDNNQAKRMHIIHDRVYNNTELDKPTNTVALNFYKKNLKKRVDDGQGNVNYNLFALVLSGSTTVTFELLGSHNYIKV